MPQREPSAPLCESDPIDSHSSLAAFRWLWHSCATAMNYADRDLIHCTTRAAILRVSKPAHG
jgi:hypothetical protein